MKARDIIPGWPRSRSTLGPVKWKADCEEVFCCHSMSYALFPFGSLEYMRTLPWMRVVPTKRGDSGYCLSLARADEQPLCEIKFCPWCGDKIGEMVDNVLEMLELAQTRHYHEEQQNSVNGYLRQRRWARISEGVQYGRFHVWNGDAA